MGTPSPGWDSLVRESLVSARRRRRRKRRRRQRLMLWLLTVVTTAVLGALALFVKDIARGPTAAPAAPSASAPTVSRGNASATAHAARPDRGPHALALAGGPGPAYSGGVPHPRTSQEGSARQVSGGQAWMVEFGMSYQDGASQALPGPSELGAVVVVARGASHAP